MALPIGGLVVRITGLVSKPAGEYNGKLATVAQFSATTGMIRPNEEVDASKLCDNQV
jgi:hypothetical protein